MYYIYRITNKINGKTYIGQHKYKKLNDKYMGSGKLIKRAIEKYGLENFKKEILVFNVPKKEHADILEKTFIASEREKGKAEYNIADGGNGGKIYDVAPFKGEHHSEEARRKMSEAKKGKPSAFKGKCHSEETKRKMSEARKGRPSNRKGVHLSDEIKMNMSEAHKGHTASEETRKKMSKAQKGKHMSEDAKRKISEANKGHAVSEETKKKISESKKGKHNSEESKKKISESLKKYYENRRK